MAFWKQTQRYHDAQQMCKHESQTPGAVFSVSGGLRGCALGGVYRRARRFHLQKQNNYRTMFLCGEKVLLQISAYLGTGNQARFPNTGVMYPPGLPKRISEAQVGILHHRCV